MLYVLPAATAMHAVMVDTINNFSSFEAFWPYYLSQHSKRVTRLVHVTGTLLALFALVKTVLAPSLGTFLAVPVFGYGFAWVAHFFVQENRPATFRYPLWSLQGDFYMLWLWLSGRLETELVRHKIIT